MRLLVHACCGPCSIMPTRLLIEQGHDIDVFYANSNIAPQAEYQKRLDELQRYADNQGFRVIEGNYDPAAWEREVAPIGEAIKDFSPAFGEEFAVRHATQAGTAPNEEIADKLFGAVFGEDPTTRHVGAASGELPTAKDAESAADEGFFARHAGAVSGEKLATEHVGAAVSEEFTAERTGASSRQGQPASIASVAELLDDERRKERCRACYRLRLEEAAAFAAQNGYDGLATTLAVSPYQFTDVIREETERAAGQAGITAHFQDYRPYYDEATRISRELGMYRQNYCGCRFSIVEGQATRAFIKQQRKAAKQAKAVQRAQEENARKERAEQKRAYADKQARKRAILKQMRERG